MTLSGSVDFPYQRDEAEEVARQVAGVSQVRNHLSVWIAVSPNEVLDRVAHAIGVDSADQLTVTARDNVVTLTGTVRSTGDRADHARRVMTIDRVGADHGQHIETHTGAEPWTLRSGSCKASWRVSSSPPG